jgi:ABC-type transport system involved in cytochrome c biogenesis permease subunit
MQTQGLSIFGNVIASAAWQSRWQSKPGYRIELATSLRSSQ